MTTVRYGARSQQVNREIEAKKNADIWSEAVTAVYETEPDIVAAVLPPPLEPGPEPLVRVTITRVEMPGLPVFGAGWIGVQARHEDRLGEYPILMPMTTEQSLTGGREVNGEPKKLAEVEVVREGDRVGARIARMGSVVCEIVGRISGTRENYELAKTDFWFKLSPSPCPTWSSVAWWTSTGPSEPRPRSAASSAPCPAPRWSRTSTSATTISRCWGRSDERPLHDHFGRRPRRVAL